MKKERNILPTSRKRLGGGGTLSKKEQPDGLKKFKKNGNQKKVIIGGIVGLILLVGGITLYRTFALYEEKKEFNVLRGRVPNFGEYDISILAITVDGEKASTIPEANNYVVNVDCQNGSGYWDYDHWNAVITEINSQTKCNLHF